MKKKEVNRSPLFYVGDKYKLITEIKTYFPTQISTFVEPFVGGGSVFLNVCAKKYILNDLDKNVIQIHKYLCSQNNDEKIFFKRVFQIINNYKLSCSYKNDIIPESLKQQYKKTYYAHFNKDSFIQLKNDYNNSDHSDVLLLYILLIYGFNRMLRFNKKGDYNLPVGNVDFNQNTYNALLGYFNLTRNKFIDWNCSDFKNFFSKIQLNESDFVYLDPPYLITFSEYNKYWNEQTEIDLLRILDQLDANHIRFAISNVTHYKGQKNSSFIIWAKKYNSHPIKSNYISYHDNSVKQFNEVLVTNY
jgi:DNA adenine methylase